MSRPPQFYPLLGTFHQRSSNVLPVIGEVKEISNEILPVSALKYLQEQCGKSSIETASVTYDGSTLLEGTDKTPILNVFFHNCVFNRVPGNQYTVHAGIYLPDSLFATHVVPKENQGGLPILNQEKPGTLEKPDALSEFSIGLDTFDDEVSWSFREDRARLRIETRVPVLSFFSILSYNLQTIQYIYATRHVVILHPASAIGSLILQETIENRIEMFFRLSQAVVNLSEDSYTEDNFFNQLTSLLFGYQVDDGTRLISKNFLSFMVYKNDRSSEDIKRKDGNYGGSTYKKYCEYASSGSVVQVRAAKSWLRQMWHLTAKEIIGYFLLL